MTESKKDNRPSWDEYFIAISREIAKRATCDRGMAGCIIVKDKRIMSTGYVGAPSGLKHCNEVGHLMKKVLKDDDTKSLHCVRTTHAEANAIAQAAKYGVPIDGSTIYVKMEPCLDCAKLIINSGIKRVVCENRYHGAEISRDFLKKAGVDLLVLNNETETYENMSEE